MALYIACSLVQAYTVLVQGIPKRLRDPAELRRWFDECIPCAVAKMQPVWDIAALKKHIERRREVINALNRLSSLLATEEAEEQTFYARWQRRLVACCCCGRRRKQTVRAIMGQRCCGVFDCCTCRSDAIKVPYPYLFIKTSNQTCCSSCQRSLLTP